MCYLDFHLELNLIFPKTLFYKDTRGKPQEIITAPLTRGTALLHR